jgi:hypothetical protein
MTSIATEVITNFEETIKVSTEIQKDSLEKTMIVILMYGILWTTGIIAIGVSFARRYNQSNLTHPNEEREEKNRSIFNQYLDDIFPRIYKPQPLLRRILHEITTHHRYITLFTSSENRRILTTIHLLTVQTMLMFMLAVCYDLQVCFNHACSQ